jgi:hypothetical protein
MGTSGADSRILTAYILHSGPQLRTPKRRQDQVARHLDPGGRVSDMCKLNTEVSDSHREKRSLITAGHRMSQSLLYQFVAQKSEPRNGRVTSNIATE